MIGIVFMYDVIGYLEKEFLDIKVEDFLDVVRVYVKVGVDFVIIYVGINKRIILVFKEDKRKLNIVFRGGLLLFVWMEMIGNENLFYEYYDELFEIFREYDVIISFGDVMRFGCIDDLIDVG